jgi:endonuclease-8
VITKGEQDVVQFDGPVLELLTETRRRFDRRLALLGPDLIAEDFDEAVFLRRLREDDPTRGIGDALLDQRTIAGIGNLWKAEGCWAARIDPWRPVAAVSDAEVLSIVHDLQPRMRASARDGNQTRDKKIYRLDGRACPRCGERILARGQGDDNRTTYWCPGCQR